MNNHFAEKSTFIVLGLARSGLAVSALLCENGHSVVACDDSADARARFASDPSVQAHTDRIRVVDTDEALAAIRRSAAVVASPGVPLSHAVITAAREAGTTVLGEIEVAWQFTGARIIGVTGTNGKSTTVGVIGSILEGAGVDVVVAGNVGTPLAQVLREGDHDAFVLELSSFQLDTMVDFHVDVAVLLNVTPDHLDRYGGSFAAYARSKARIAAGATGNSWYVYNADDEVASGVAAEFPGNVIGFSSSRALAEGVFSDGDDIVLCWKGARHVVAARSDFTPVGVHNLENAMAAIGAAFAFGVEATAMRNALRSYRPLPHRMELVRVIGGVAYVNDSKATNVDAAVKSLRSIEGLAVMILGGRDKDGDFTTLRPLGARVRVAILIGEAADTIRAALVGACETRDAEDMEAAVRLARDVAQPGDTVLLAPACASFDMFKNYEHRGEEFRACVNAL